MDNNPMDNISSYLNEMNLKTTDINRLIETLGIKALSGGK